MQRRRLRPRKRSPAWFLTLLLLIALLGVSLVNEPEPDASADARARHASFEAGAEGAPGEEGERQSQRGRPEQ